MEANHRLEICVNGHHTNGDLGSPEVAKICLSINEDNVIDGARQVLEVIRPNWKSEDIKFKVNDQVGRNTK